MPFLLVLLVLVCSLVPASAAAQWDSATATLLAQADTGAALARLRQQARATDSPESWCALARLLTSKAAMHQSANAPAVLQSSPNRFASGRAVKEKQGTRADAIRMLNRVEGRLASDSGEATTAFRAELLYHRALLMDDWLRNFDYLVQVPGTLPISTPDCAALGDFCENFVHPGYFNERFLHAPRLASVISHERPVVVQLLDSA